MRTIKTIYQGEVIDVNDNMDSGVIKVRIPDIDQNIADIDLAPCYPAFNYQFHRVLPKKGERVSIFFDRFYDTDKRLNQEKRYWNSVIVADVRNINYDPYYFSSSANQTDGWFIPKQKSVDDISFRGLKLADDDISLRGRNNTDIIFKPDELLLRSGRHVKGNPNIFNGQDQSYIQIKYKKNYASTIDGKEVEYITRYLPTLHLILLSTTTSEVLIKIIDLKTTNIVETFSQTYPNEALFYRSVINKLNEFKEKYPSWEFKTSDERFSSLPLVFENAIQVESPKDIENRQTEPVINIVSNKINLISNATAPLNVNNADGLINNETQVLLNDQLQRMVRGENLLAFLDLLRNAVVNHVHPYPNMIACQTEIIQKILSFNLEDIVNDDIRIS